MVRQNFKIVVSYFWERGYRVSEKPSAVLFLLYSTVTDFARFLGWSTSLPFRTAI